MPDSQLLYSNTYLTDLVTRRCEWTDESGKTLHKQRQQPLADVLPEESMSALEQYIGDAGGRVSVGAELSNSENFCGAKAFVNISVTCHNDVDTCMAVHDLVQPAVRQLVNQDLGMMIEDRNAYHVAQASSPQAGAVEPGRVSAGPPMANPRPAATSATPPRPINPTRPPSYRR